MEKVKYVNIVATMRVSITSTSRMIRKWNRKDRNNEKKEVSWPLLASKIKPSNHALGKKKEIRM